MSRQKEAFEEIVADFHHNVKRWKLGIKHMENELIFLDRLLGTEVLSNLITRTTRERRNLLKKMVKLKAQTLTDLKDEVESHEAALLNLKAHKKLRIDTSYRQRHESLRIRIEKFRKSFDEFRSRVLLQAGSVL